jgi:hypothetical protein
MVAAGRRGWELKARDEARPAPEIRVLVVAEEDAGLLRRARRDALPEHTQYADTGCEVHPSCLSCPLVRCRFDEPGGARRLLSEGRDRQIVALRLEGEGISQIARRFSVSRRTVFRALARAAPRRG